MQTIVKMPSLSPSMKTGNLVKWIKNIGEEIKVGDIIAEIDTDKATMEVESLYEGILENILIPEGTHEVKIGTPIAIINNDNDNGVKEEINIEIKNEDKDNNNTNIANEEKLKKISPLARKIALEHRLDINTINNGTGPRGRIVKSDIQQVIENSCLNLEYAKNISGFRLAMINTLVKSKQEIPHFYMNITANVTKLVELLDDIKKQDCIETKITVNTFVIKAVAKAIEKYSDINVYWEENTVIKNKTIDVSVAVAVEDGIYTPIIRKANNKNIQDIAEEIKELAFRAKNKKLKTEEFKGGSITISNLGMCDIDCFYSIINPPQASIVSVARIIKKPVVVKETIEIGYTLTLGYAIDHRVIDGLYAAKFLAEIKRLLENPIKVLL